MLVASIGIRWYVKILQPATVSPTTVNCRYICTLTGFTSITKAMQENPVLRKWTTLSCSNTVEKIVCKLKVICEVFLETNKDMFAFSVSHQIELCVALSPKNTPKAFLSSKNICLIDFLDDWSQLMFTPVFGLGHTFMLIFRCCCFCYLLLFCYYY